jgi:hypothetical protein
MDFHLAGSNRHSYPLTLEEVQVQSSNCPLLILTASFPICCLLRVCFQLGAAMSTNSLPAPGKAGLHSLGSESREIFPFAWRGLGPCPCVSGHVRIISYYRHSACVVSVFL